MAKNSFIKSWFLFAGSYPQICFNIKINNIRVDYENIIKEAYNSIHSAGILSVLECNNNTTTNTINVFATILTHSTLI